MDLWSSDIERFNAELQATLQAQAEQQKWMQEMTKRQNNLRALVQLIACSASETGRSLPVAVAEVANQYGLAHIIAGLPVEDRSDLSADNIAAPSRPAESVPDHEGDLFTSTWIVNQVLNSGDSGISPPEILQRAKAAGIKMHHNYPYIVLRKAIERRKVIKVGARYLKGTH